MTDCISVNCDSYRLTAPARLVLALAASIAPQVSRDVKKSSYVICRLHRFAGLRANERCSGQSEYHVYGAFLTQLIARVLAYFFCRIHAVGVDIAPFSAMVNEEEVLLLPGLPLMNHPGETDDNELWTFKVATATPHRSLGDTSPNAPRVMIDYVHPGACTYYCHYMSQQPCLARLCCLVTTAAMLLIPGCYKYDFFRHLLLLLSLTEWDLKFGNVSWKRNSDEQAAL